MNRVDEHEVRAGLGGGVGQQALQVAVIAHAPGLVGAHGVHLGHPAPTMVLGDGCRHFDMRGGVDDGGFGGAFIGGDMQGVVAHRQRAGKRDGGMCGVEIWQGVEVFLEGAAVFQGDGCGDVAVGVAVDLHGGGFADRCDDGGWDELGALVPVVEFEGMCDRLIGGCVDAQCGENGDKRLVADFGVCAELVEEGGR